MAAPAPFTCFQVRLCWTFTLALTALVPELQASLPFTLTYSPTAARYAIVVLHLIYICFIEASPHASLPNTAHPLINHIPLIGKRLP